MKIKNYFLPHSFGEIIQTIPYSNENIIKKRHFITFIILICFVTNL